MKKVGDCMDAEERKFIEREIAKKVKKEADEVRSVLEGNGTKITQKDQIYYLIKSVDEIKDGLADNRKVVDNFMLDKCPNNQNDIYNELSKKADTKFVWKLIGVGGTILGLFIAAINIVIKIIP